MGRVRSRRRHLADPQRPHEAQQARQGDWRRPPGALELARRGQSALSAAADRCWALRVPQPAHQGPAHVRCDGAGRAAPHGNRPPEAHSKPWPTTSSPGSRASTNLATSAIDKFGADCLFQIISHRYERGATLVPTNRITSTGPASSTTTPCSPRLSWTACFTTPRPSSSRARASDQRIRSRSENATCSGVGDVYPRKSARTGYQADSIFRPTNFRHVRAGAHPS